MGSQINLGDKSMMFDDEELSNGIGRNKYSNNAKSTPDDLSKDSANDSESIYVLRSSDILSDDSEKVELTSLLNTPIIIQSVSFQDSMFYEGEYARVMLDGNKYFTTSSSVLIDRLREYLNRLPMKCTIVGKESKKGRTYYTLGPV